MRITGQTFSRSVLVKFVRDIKGVTLYHTTTILEVPAYFKCGYGSIEMIFD